MVKKAPYMVRIFSGYRDFYRKKKNAACGDVIEITRRIAGIIGLFKLIFLGF